MSSSDITATDIANLLPVLQKLSHVEPKVQATSSTSSSFTTADMFSKKKKNTKSTAAQNYLMNIVRESARAADIWDSAPYICQVPPASIKLFYDTAFTLCPELKASRHLLRSRLSATLINRRQYLKRIGKLPMLSVTSTSIVSIVSDSNLVHKARPSATNKSTGTCVTPNLPVFRPGDNVIIKNRNGAKLGKALFLRLLTEDSNEEFSKILFQSAVKNISADEIELPQLSDRGAVTFDKLQKGDIFTWKTSRLSTLIVNESDAHDAHDENKEILNDPTNNDEAEYEHNADSDDEMCISEYEHQRLQRIKENQKVLKRLDLISVNNKKIKKFKKSSKKSVTKPVKLPNKPSTSRKEIEIEEDIDIVVTNKKRRIEPNEETPSIGENIAVFSKLYMDRPQLGQVVANDNSGVTIDWYMGKYSGTWKWWKGKSNGEEVVYTDDIPIKNIVLRDIVFNKGMRLDPSTITTLKAAYKKLDLED